MSKEWTPKDDQVLEDGIGSFGWQWFQKKTSKPHDGLDRRRSKAAIYMRLRRMGISGGLTRGTFSLQQVSTATGYSISQLRRAQSALGQRWKRTSRTGPYLILEEQVEELLEWLKHDYWCKSLRLYGCVNCGTQVRPHYSGGQCRRCYYQRRRETQRYFLPFTKKEVLDFVQKVQERQLLQHEVGWVERLTEWVTQGKTIVQRHIEWIETLR